VGSKSFAEFAEGKKIVRQSRISCFSVAPHGARKAIQIDLRGRALWVNKAVFDFLGVSGLF